VSAAKFEGRTIQNEELSRAILEHYRAVHNNLSAPLPAEIPQLNLRYDEIEHTYRNVHWSKATNFDGIPNELFNLRKRERCKPQADLCLEYCKKW
jgi:hypothetical protein